MTRTCLLYHIHTEQLLTVLGSPEDLDFVGLAYRAARDNFQVAPSLYLTRRVLVCAAPLTIRI